MVRSIIKYRAFTHVFFEAFPKLLNHGTAGSYLAFLEQVH